MDIDPGRRHPASREDVCRSGTGRRAHPRPYTRLYIFDGKGGKGWEAAEQVAHRFVCGDELQDAEAVRNYLVELDAEVQSRYTHMSILDDYLCPESTPFGRQMGELGCHPRRGRTTSDDGAIHQVRGYFAADLRAAIDEYRNGQGQVGGES